MAADNRDGRKASGPVQSKQARQKEHKSEKLGQQQKRTRQTGRAAKDFLLSAFPEATFSGCLPAEGATCIVAAKLGKSQIQLRGPC